MEEGWKEELRQSPDDKIADKVGEKIRGGKHQTPPLGKNTRGRRILFDIKPFKRETTG